MVSSLRGILGGNCLRENCALEGFSRTKYSNNGIAIADRNLRWNRKFWAIHRGILGSRGVLELHQTGRINHLS